MDVDGDGELLYESETTRVVRRRGKSSGHRVICKHYLGPEADLRVRRERKVLDRLSGIDGIAHATPDQYGDDVLVLRDCGASSLAQFLKNGGCSIEFVLALAPRLARVVEEIHRVGVVHRDINPGNIVLCSDGNPVLIDFEYASLPEDRMSSHSQAPIVGTLAYLAPEQSGRTGRGIDQRSDLYSLGATLYELTTGRPPFEASDALELVHAHLVREPVAPSQINPHVPPTLCAIILRLLAKAPEQRYQSAEGVLHDLGRAGAAAQAGSDALLDLGERDFPAVLVPPRQLVGRETELIALRSAFSGARLGTQRVVLVRGEAGVGKTALISELRAVVSAAGGWYVYGKCDQFQRGDATKGALTQALQALARLVLALSAGELGEFRTMLLQSLGPNAGNLSRLVPEFGLILGQQPVLPEAGAAQAGLRLRDAVADLLRVVALRGRPLVIVLDDLQWTAAPLIGTMTRLMGESGLRGVLLVGAYRPAEVGAGHALLPALAQWRERSDSPLEIEVANLPPSGTGDLLASMLRMPALVSARLAHSIHGAAAGNPFDTVEMVNALRRNGLLKMCERGWEWSDAHIRAFGGRGDVVDLLAARIAALPDTSRQLLRIMSCIGGAMSFEFLAAAASLAPGELVPRLRLLLDDGLVADEDDQGDGDNIKVVCLRHDRVQQAALHGIPDDERDRIHLTLARRLASAGGFEGEAARQYVECCDLLADHAEIRRAADRFWDLACTLAAAGTYEPAQRYLSAASVLLAKLGDPADERHRREIDIAQHKALYSLGRLAECDQLFAAIRAKANDPLDFIEAADLQFYSLAMRLRLSDVASLAHELLKGLGVEMKTSANDVSLDDRLAALKDWVAADARTHSVDRVQIADLRTLAIARVLSRVTRPSTASFDAQSICRAALEGQRLWAMHGPCADLVACLSHLCGVLVSQRQDYRTAFDMGRHAIKVGESLGYESQTWYAQGIFATLACHWIEPLETAIEHARDACERLQAAGDWANACALWIPVSILSLDCSPTLGISVAEVRAGIAMGKRAGNLHAFAVHARQMQLLRALRGGSQDEETEGEPGFHAADQVRVLSGKSPFLRLHNAVNSALYALIMGEDDDLVSAATLAEECLEGVLQAYYLSVQVHFLRAMACARTLLQVANETSPDAGTTLAVLDANLRWLSQRASDQPANVLHLVRLVEAERAWALGDLAGAQSGFDTALAQAEGRPRHWQRALITERAARFYMRAGLGQVGRRFLGDAHARYRDWGANVKVACMEREYPFLRAPGVRPTAGLSGSGRGSDRMTSDSLDLMGILRASQALSSETRLPRLTARVTEVLEALTGATTVLVLSWAKDQWWLNGSEAERAWIPALQAAGEGLLPMSALDYAERTGDALLVEDACSDDRFSRDPYFAGMRVCSLMVTIVPAQAAKTLLLLENRQGRAAFNAERLDAVMLIAGQLAVSLANAQLYESLEQRVGERTRELRETHAQLVATARRAGQAEIANNVLHNVGNLLNSVNVSASVMRTAVNNSKIDGLQRAVGLLNEHADDLATFVAHGNRGETLLAYLNGVLAVLQQERTSLLENLSRLAAGVEHIGYVVAGQQSLAGPSSVEELVEPRELFQEALRMSFENLARNGVKVVEDYATVPAAVMDKQRALMVLVNLIRNAVQALEGVPSEARRLTLGCCIVAGQEGENRLHITVQDTGEGIPKDHLNQLFSHGFTTRKGGHGFGLHSSALAAIEMGGRLMAQSGGPGVGATFTLELPLSNAGRGAPASSRS